MWTLCPATPFSENTPSVRSTSSSTTPTEFENDARTEVDWDPPLQRGAGCYVHPLIVSPGFRVVF